MFPLKIIILEGKKMRRFEDCKNMTFDLSSIGGNHPYTLDELINEVVRHRRSGFIRNLFALTDGQTDGSKVFDAIAFIAATSDFDTNGSDTNYEGEIIYDVTAGGDWVWHCKTKVTWNSALPVAGGYCQYHTDVVPNENVNPYRVNAMTGTGMTITVIKNSLKSFTFKEALQRDLANMKK